MKGLWAGNEQIRLDMNFHHKPPAVDVNEFVIYFVLYKRDFPTPPPPPLLLRLLYLSLAIPVVVILDIFE